MFAWGRRPAHFFQLSERLFVRFKPDVGYQEHEADTTIEQTLVEQIRSPEWSANRSLMSRPVDVLFPANSDWGVWMNKSLNFVIRLRGKDAFGRRRHRGMVQAPRSLPRSRAC